ncbi:MAG: UvrB/UvrC motif-containing protein [Oscillospiraceae bacterium]|nr:UvrB/UvrC motif-containing protein [Oscillospiraceae bacterium]
MKCEKCNVKEAEVFCSFTINGSSTRHSFCAGCAEEEGLGDCFSIPGGRVFESFFRKTDGFFNDFYEPAGFFGPMRYTPFAALLPQAAEACMRAVPAEPAAEESNIPDDAGEGIRKKRELTALRHQMKAAAREEDFEKAAEIRDKIKKLGE